MAGATRNRIGMTSRSLQYTSGSTGTPKGVMLTHGCLLHNLGRMREVLGLSAETPGVTWLPAFHDMGLIGNFLQAIFSGLSLTILSPAAFAHDPLLWLRTISKRRAYVSGGPCFAFQHCVSRLTPDAVQGLDLNSLERRLRRCRADHSRCPRPFCDGVRGYTVFVGKPSFPATVWPKRP